jgi:hypothetical protein
MRTTNTPREGRVNRATGPRGRRTPGAALAAALTRRPHSGRLLRSAAVSAAALSLGVLALAAPAAQANQRPATREQVRAPVPTAKTAPSAITYKYTFSRVAWTGSVEVIAATDAHGDLYYFWQASGSTTWHRQLVASGGYSKPCITWTGQDVAIAALDSSGDLFYFTQPGSGTTWASQLVATASSGKYQAPSVTVSPGGQVLISAGNSSGELVSFTLNPGSTSWSEQTVAFGRFGPSSVATAESALGLITASSGGTLYFWYESLAFPGWSPGQTVASPGSGGSYTGGSIAASNAYIVIAAATTTGAVDAFTQLIGGTGWTAQPVSASGGPYASPQVAWTGLVNGTSNSYDVITAANKAGTLDYWWTPDGATTAWNSETVAANGQQAVYAHPGIAATGSSVVITAINTRPGSVTYFYQPFQTNSWNKETVAKG